MLLSNYPAKKTHLVIFDVLKFIAIALVLNSHFDVLYPDSMKVLATGGVWGNVLFFAISGYFMKPVVGSFLDYLKKKVFRLYLSVWVFSVILVILGKVSIDSPIAFLKVFLWPTNYWFVAALVIYDLAFYIIECKGQRLSHKKRFFIFSVTFFVLFILFYILFIDYSEWCMEKMGFESTAGWLKIIYYFYIFTLSYSIKNNVVEKASILPSLVLTIVGGIGYIGFKMLLLNKHMLMPLQIVLPVFAYLLAYGAICFTINCQEIYNNQNSKTHHFWEVVVCPISQLSLEIYLVQFGVIDYFSNDFRFPINIFLTIIFVVIIAGIIKMVADYLLSVFVSVPVLAREK